MDIYYSIITLVILTLISAYFSASETALFSLSSIKIKAYQTNPDPRKQLIAKLVMQPRDLLVTVFMLNTLVNILLQNVASDMFGIDARWELTIGVPLALTLIFGEIIPKYIGIQNNVNIAYSVIPSINYFQNILKPLRKLIIYLTLPISRAMFFFLKKEDSISKEELEHVLKKSEESKPEILSIGEIRKLTELAFAHNHDWRHVWALALLTGMRNGELLSTQKLK